MNIPARIVKLGATQIEEYAKLSLKKERLHNESLTLENKIQEAFIAVNKQIGRFLPDSGRSMDSDSFVYESNNYRHLVPKLNGSDPLNNIYATEELLKEIRELVLDDRAIKTKIEWIQSQMKKF